MTEPVYYSKNGLSPLSAMKNGLISKREYIGFLKGNVIKYTIRAEDKEGIEDINKAIDYLNHLKKEIEKEKTCKNKINIDQHDLSCNNCINENEEGE